MCDILGTPSFNEWPEGYKLANNINIKFAHTPSKELQNLIENASPEAIDLIQ